MSPGYPTSGRGYHAWLWSWLGLPSRSVAEARRPAGRAGKLPPLAARGSRSLCGQERSEWGI